MSDSMLLVLCSLFSASVSVIVAIGVVLYKREHGDGGDSGNAHSDSGDDGGGGGDSKDKGGNGGGTVSFWDAVNALSSMEKASNKTKDK